MQSLFHCACTDTTFSAKGSEVGCAQEEKAHSGYATSIENTSIDPCSEYSL